MYAIATRWTFKAGSGEEALGINKDEVMPAVESQPGHVHTVIVRTGPDTFLSCVCWETEDDAKRTVADLSPLLIRHLGHLVRGVEPVSGSVVYQACASRAIRPGGSRGLARTGGPDELTVDPGLGDPDAR